MIDAILILNLLTVSFATTILPPTLFPHLVDHDPGQLRPLDLPPIFPPAKLCLKLELSRSRRDTVDDGDAVDLEAAVVVHDVVGLEPQRRHDALLLAVVELARAVSDGAGDAEPNDLADSDGRLWVAGVD